MLMKKKILLTLACVFFLIGIVDAQDDLIVSIDGTVGECRKTTSKNVPAFCANNWAITQQFYTAEEICMAYGFIESIAFKTAEEIGESGKYPFTRKFEVYMVNTEEYAIAGNTMKVMSESDKVFHGDVAFSYDSWIVIDVSDFEYTGKNVLICVNDVTGSNVAGGITFDAFVAPAMIGENNAYRALYKRSISGAFDATTTISGASTILDTPVPFVRFTFKEGTTIEYLEPVTPENFTATVLNESEVLLSWDDDENTSSYDVCKNTEVIANVTETSYVVKDLSLGWHCFKVIGVNGVKKSPASEIQCVELVETPEGLDEDAGMLMSSFPLYPNPVEDKLFVDIATEIKEVEAFDVLGKSQNLRISESHGITKTIDVSNLDAGIYLMRIVVDEGQIVKRFVKK